MINGRFAGFYILSCNVQSFVNNLVCFVNGSPDKVAALFAEIVLGILVADGN